MQGIILAINEQEEQEIKSLLNHYGIKKVIGVGTRRKGKTDSVYNGVNILWKNGIVLVHDAARPFIDMNRFIA